MISKIIKNNIYKIIVHDNFILLNIIKRGFRRLFRYITFYERQSYKPPQKCFSCAFFYKCMGSCTYEKKSINADCQYIYLKKVYDAYYSKIK